MLKSIIVFNNLKQEATELLLEVTGEWENYKETGCRKTIKWLYK